MFNIFEHPWGLLAVAILTVLVVWVLGCIFPQKRRWWQWLIPVLIAASAFGADRLVKTDTEKIKAVIKTGTKAVEEENQDAIKAILSENYSDSLHYNKVQMMRHCRIKLSVLLIKKTYTRFVSIDISGTVATAVFTVRIILDPQSYAAQGFKTQMLLKLQTELKKRNERWLISRVELVTIDLQPATWKGIQQLGP